MLGDATNVKLARGQLLVSPPGEPDPDLARTLLDRWYLDRAWAVFSEVLAASLRPFKGIEHPRLKDWKAYANLLIGQPKPLTWPAGTNNCATSCKRQLRTAQRPRRAD